MCVIKMQFFYEFILNIVKVIIRTKFNKSAQKLQLSTE